MYSLCKSKSSLAWLLPIVISFSHYISTINALPPFPLLSGFAHLTQRAHILSEVTKEGQAKFILEEYVNFESASEHVTKTTIDEKHEILIDGLSSTIFDFKPYNCELLKRDELLERYDFKDIWSIESPRGTLKKLPIKSNLNSTDSMPIVGVAAIWLNVASRALTYAKVSMNKHKWDTFYGNYRLTLFFDNQDSVMRLSSIECRDTAFDKFVFGINIIQVEYSIEKDKENKMFTLPIVYGCSKILKELGYESIATDENDGTLEKINIQSSSSYEIIMEISASSFSNYKEMKSKTDVMDLVIAFASLDDLDSSHADKTEEANSAADVKLVHARGFSDRTTPEMKEISDHSTGVKYRMNMDKNDCMIQRLSQDSMRLAFKNNNVSLEIDDAFVEKLLHNSSDYILNAKWVTEDKTTEYLYYEREEYDCDSIFGCKHTTMSRTYSRACDTRGPKGGRKNENAAELDVVKAIVYNDDRTQIEHIYLFMITSYKTDLTFSERAKLFDLSSCFRDPNQHKWVNVHYPLDRENIPDLSDYFYAQHSDRKKLQLNFLRTPKIEQTYEDFHVVMRALLLDIKADPMIRFDLVPGLTFRDNQEEVHVAANLKHCSDICKMYNCHMFSFCSNNECKVTVKSESIDDATMFNSNEGITPPIKDSAMDRIQRDRSCTLYIENLQDSISINIKRRRSKIAFRPLNDILAQCSHDEYSFYHSTSDLDLSRHREPSVSSDMPDLTFTIPNFWTGQQQKTYENHRQYYRSSIAMIPVSFEIENDPMVEIMDNSEDEEIYLEGDAIGATFHESLGRRRFKLNVKTNWQLGTGDRNSEATTGAYNSDDKQQQEYALETVSESGDSLVVINSQSYEQCALLCIDRGSDCGSFSYCNFDRQCITSGLNDRKSLLASSTEDSQCVIVQRDFLAKFSPLQERTQKPAINENSELDQLTKLIKKTSCQDEHDCAHQCMTELDFNCLSFDFCQNLKEDGAKMSVNDSTDACYLHATRKITSQEGSTSSDLLISNQQRSSIRFRSTKKLPCQRYQRSYLADFNRLDHRKLALATTDNFVQMTGVNVDECASKCVENNYNYCKLFQFCYKRDKSPHQTCSIAVNSAKIARSSLVFQSDCYVYTMKKDITTRSIYINSTSGGKQLNEDVLVDDSGIDNNNSASQTNRLSTGFMLAITIMTFIVSLTIGAGIVIREHYKEQIEQKYRRLKTLWFGVER